MNKVTQRVWTLIAQLLLASCGGCGGLSTIHVETDLSRVVACVEASG